METNIGGPGHTVGHPEADLRGRIPGQSVMAKLLEEQETVPRRRFLGRLFGASPLGSESGSWYKGALGEMEVGRILAELGSGYEVLHAVPVGKAESDIDHVVIGPPGVFTLNTKNHSGQRVWVGGSTFMVNGARSPHIPNAVYEARRAARLLSAAAGEDVPVSALLVLIEPAALTIKKRPAGVEILTARRLPRWLSRQPQVLGPADVERIAAVARRPGVWHENPPESQAADSLRSGFDALDRSVRRARLRRQLWGGGVLAAVAGGLIWGVPQLVGTAFGGLFGSLLGG